MRRVLTGVWTFLAVLGLCARGAAFTHAHADGDDQHRHGRTVSTPAHHRVPASPRGSHAHPHRHPSDPARDPAPCPEAPTPEAPGDEHSHVADPDTARGAQPATVVGAGLLDAARPLHPGARRLGGAGADHRPVRPGPGTGPPTSLLADDLIAHLLGEGSGLRL